MKRPDLILNMEQAPQETHSGERTLWIAVVERAMKDYCFFFDWWESYSKVYKHKAEHKLFMGKKNNLTLRAIGEINRLRWFLFDTTPKPYNLEYISTELYDEPGIKENLRKIAKEQFKLNLDKTIADNRFKPITDYVIENTDAYKQQSAAEESNLKQKRFRLNLD